MASPASIQTIAKAKFHFIHSLCGFSRQFRKLTGWGTWIRTKINGVRVRCSTIELCPTNAAEITAFDGFTSPTEQFRIRFDYAARI